MPVIQITQDIAFKYADRIPPELLNDLDREYFRGLAVENDIDGQLQAAMIWEMKKLEDLEAPAEAEILWLWVDDEEGGEALLSEFELSVQNFNVDATRFELESLEPAERRVLISSGFEISEAESRDICVTVEEMVSLSPFHREVRPVDYIKSLADITTSQFKAGIMDSAYHGRYGLLDDLPFLPMTRYDPDISSCTITDDKINGLLLVHKTVTGIFIVELLFAMEPDANINLLKMMRFSAGMAKALCDPEDIVILRRHNEASKALVHKLFPDKKGNMVFRGEKQNEY